jgi:hypothetical protein
VATHRGDAARAAELLDPRRLMRIPAYVMFGVAVLALLIAAYLALRSAAFLLGADRLSGEVVRVESSTFVEDEITRTAYWPVIRYLARNNEPAEWKGPAARDLSKYGPGDKVELLRGSGSEPRIETNAFSALWSWSVVCVVLAWTFGGIGVLMRLVDAEGAPVAIAAFCVFLGVPLLVGGIARGGIDFAALREGAWASGMVSNGQRVERASSSADAASRGQVWATVRMTAADGREVELIDERSNAIDYAPGAKVEVLYLPGRPYAGRIYTPLSYWLATLILLGIGLPLTAIGCALLRRAE